MTRRYTDRNGPTLPPGAAFWLRRLTYARRRGISPSDALAHEQARWKKMPEGLWDIIAFLWRTIRRNPPAFDDVLNKWLELQDEHNRCDLFA